MMLCIWALAAVCCSDDELGSSQTSVKSGDEVQFGLSLAGSARTVYGTEDDGAFPILWKNGDKVQILSPQCLAGRDNAEYQVTVDADKNYADALTKTGAAGVQWGSTNSGINFYSVYPSGQYTINSAKTEIQGLKINELQYFDVPVNGICKPNMTECLMFAKTTGVTKTDEPVILTYAPISTSIRLTLKAAPESVSNKTFQIQNVKLSAFDKNAKNVNIVGSFALNLGDNSFAAWMKDQTNKDLATNSVSAKIGGDASTGYYTMKPGESLTLPLFIAPQKDLTVQYWKIEVQTSYGTFTKTINEELTLIPNQVHKLTLPTLSIDDDSEWDVATWMTHIPRNVYLSEVSIPGSWNSLNKDFQGTSPSIDSQYAIGVRAFHLDCRWTTTLKAGGALFADDFYKPADLKPENMYLSVADGAGGSHVRSGSSALSGSLGQVMKQNNTSFKTYLEQVTSNVKPDEYMILFCSFAQDSYNDTSKTGKTWMQAISDVCATNDFVYDARNLNANTVVGDVLYKVIVIVNLEGANDVVPTDSKCLFCHIPNHLSSDYFPTTGFKTEGLWTSSSSSSITMAVSQAQITSSTGSAIPDGTRGYYPSMTQRTTVVGNILDWSKNNYTNTTNYTHDKWIYLGLGGNMASNKSSKGDSGTESTVTNTFLPIINDRIKAMGKDGVPFYPVGIVYFNSTTSTAKETVKNILMLNNSYRLPFDGTKPAFPNTNLSAVDYDSYNTVGGNAFQTK